MTTPSGRRDRAWFTLSIAVVLAVVAIGNFADIPFAWVMVIAAVTGLVWGVGVFAVLRRPHGRERTSEQEQQPPVAPSA